ncbi:OadG family protein [Pseudomonas benzenivorans]|uniref:Probable oxaloacetate decarboxylase gamma chain n=1 Tax=Pseudomonas benzenivorans TaxID=556533 RepID=A0ABY5H4P4_9PSED|nr:OadG family protein [Pseudomonas benzenivorans]UTW07260.1 OadG family protein [Pseudomonas benzenivorans]
MTPSQLLLEGVELMLFGMGSVFIFLALLILSIRLMARLLGRFAASAPQRAVVTPAAAKAPSHDPEPDVLAAIQAAIHQHRARRG